MTDQPSVEEARRLAWALNVGPDTPLTIPALLLRRLVMNAEESDKRGAKADEYRVQRDKARKEATAVRRDTLREVREAVEGARKAPLPNVDRVYWQGVNDAAGDILRALDRLEARE